MMGELAAPWLLVMAVLPLLVAALTWSNRLRRWALRLGPLCAVPALVTSLFQSSAASDLVSWLLFGVSAGLDETGRVALFASATIWFVAAVFAQTTDIEGGRRARFFRYFYGSMAGNFLLIVAADAATFMAGFALMSFAGYGLVIHRQDREAVRASRVYMALVILAEFTLFAAVVICWIGAGSWELVAIREQLATGGALNNTAIALLFIGFGVKAGLVPLHVWLPLAHPVAPVAASAVLSAAMIKAGLIGWIRFLPFSEPGLAWLGHWALAAGLMAAFGGVIAGIVQSRPKVILAYSSISQMGFMTVLLAMAAIAPELYPAVLLAVLVYLLHHAVAKGALFLSVTVAKGAPHRTSWKILEAMGLLFPALALAGAPLTTGALAKSELKKIPHLREEVFSAFLDPILAAGAVATVVLVVRFLWVVWPRGRRDEEISYTARAIWLVLATGVVWGPWAVPWSHLRRVGIEAMTPSAVWSGFWPLAVGVVVAIAVSRARHLFPFRVHEAIPAGDLVVLAESVERGLRRGWYAVVGGLREMNDRVVDVARKWFKHRVDDLMELEVLERRLLAQAWDWVWILVIAVALLLAVVW